MGHIIWAIKYGSVFPENSSINNKREPIQVFKIEPDHITGKLIQKKSKNNISRIPGCDQDRYICLDEFSSNTVLMIPRYLTKTDLVLIIFHG